MAEEAVKRRLAWAKGRMEGFADGVLVVTILVLVLGK